jgi:hypothetical protein
VQNANLGIQNSLTAIKLNTDELLTLWLQKKSTPKSALKLYAENFLFLGSQRRE